jgi:hypothetical protein
MAATSIAATGGIEFLLRDGYWEIQAEGMVVWRVGLQDTGTKLLGRAATVLDTFEQIAGWECTGNLFTGGQFHVFDLNSNGRQDLAYSNWRYNSFVRESTADNTFSLVHQVSNPVGSYYTRLICAGDGDSDGRAELVFGSGTSGAPRDLFIMESRRVGMYPDTITAVIPEVDIGVSHMSMADLDGDGLREYVGTAQGGHDRLVAIWENRGDNSYARVFSDHPGPQTSVSGEPSVEDFDGDGRGDLVVVQSDNPSFVHVYESKGNDVYQHVWSAEVQTENMYWSTPGPDLDRDGRGDFVVVAGDGLNEAEWRFILFEATGDNAYAPVWTHRVTGGWIDGGAATGDLDGDGWNELVCQVGGKTQVLQFAGNDSLEVVWELAGPVVGQGKHRVIAPDLDSDGRGELIWWTQDNPGNAVVYERILPAAELPWEDAEGPAPDRLPYLQSIPNPFTRRAVIRYEVHPTCGSCSASLGIFDSNGRRIRTWTLGPQAAGTGHVDWDGQDQSGGEVPDGAYFLRLQAGGTIRTDRMIRVH